MSFLEKHADKWMPEPNSGCWLWTGALSNGKYGHTKEGYAHRIVCEEVNGACPDRMEASHLCEVTLCVNPAHLAWETPRTNNRRRSEDAKRRMGGKRYGTLRGAYWNVNKRRWQSCIHTNGTQTHLGYFDSEEQAHRAYERALVAIKAERK